LYLKIGFAMEKKLTNGGWKVGSHKRACSSKL
jgi:hypothetical protein